MDKILIRDGFEPEAVREAAALLEKGEPVAFPTETVYGLGADAFNPVAVARIFELKKRPHFDPLIVHIADRGWAERLASPIPGRGQAAHGPFLARTLDDHTQEEGSRA